MIYIETNKEISLSFADELKAAGLPGAYSITTRRIINGVVEKGYPRAVSIDVDESQRATVQSIIDAHNSFFGYVERKITETKEEANRRIVERIPEWKQRNYLAYSLEITRKQLNNEAVTPEEQATLSFIESEWAYVKSIRTASDLIEAEINALTDAEALTYNVKTNPAWP